MHPDIRRYDSESSESDTDSSTTATSNEDDEDPQETQPLQRAPPPPAPVYHPPVLLKEGYVERVSDDLHWVGGGRNGTWSRIYLILHDNRLAYSKKKGENLVSACMLPAADDIDKASMVQLQVNPQDSAPNATRKPRSFRFTFSPYGATDL